MNWLAAAGNARTVELLLPAVMAAAVACRISHCINL